MRRTRLLKELCLLKDLHEDGISLEIDFVEIECPFNFQVLNFEINGPEGTPFSNQKLKLEIRPTDRFPLEPPIVRFVSSVRHPNIDEVSGRICLDLLRMPPEGSWRPNISLGSLLISIQVLLGCPNLDDPVRPDLISEWIKFDDQSNKNNLISEKDNSNILTHSNDYYENNNNSNNNNSNQNNNNNNNNNTNTNTNKRLPLTSLSLSALRKKSKS